MNLADQLVRGAPHDQDVSQPQKVVIPPGHVIQHEYALQDNNEEGEKVKNVQH